MGDVLESLFSVLPVVLAILWILRRVAKKTSDENVEASVAKKARQKAQREARKEARRTAFSASGAFRADTASAPRLEPSREAQIRRKNTLEEVMARVTEFAESRGEDELYDKPEPRRVPQPSASANRSAKEETHTLFDDGQTEPEAAAEYSRKATSSLERISKLPPVAQGILWSVILDKPVGMKDPSEGAR